MHGILHYHTRILKLFFLFFFFFLFCLSVFFSSQTLWNNTLASCPATAVCFEEGNQTWITVTDYQERCKCASSVNVLWSKKKKKSTFTKQLGLPDPLKLSETWDTTASFIRDPLMSGQWLPLSFNSDSARALRWPDQLLNKSIHTVTLKLLSAIKWTTSFSP